MIKHKIIYDENFTLKEFHTYKDNKLWEVNILNNKGNVIKNISYRNNIISAYALFDDDNNLTQRYSNFVKPNYWKKNNGIVFEGNDLDNLYPMRYNQTIFTETIPL